MADYVEQIVDVGTNPGDGTGDGGRTSFQKIVANFDQIFKSMTFDSTTNVITNVTFGAGDIVGDMVIGGDLLLGGASVFNPVGSAITSGIQLESSDVPGLIMESTAANVDDQTVMQLDATYSSQDSGHESIAVMVVKSSGATAGKYGGEIRWFTKADNGSINVIAALILDNLGNAIAGGVLSTTSTLEASSPTVAALKSAGGLGVAKKSFFGDEVNIGTEEIASHATADDFVISSPGATGMTIGSGNTSTGSIFFADAQSNLRGQLIYNHNTNVFEIHTDGSKAVLFNSSQEAVFTGIIDASASGIYLGTADSDHLLNNYEENGTWTVVFDGSSGSAGSVAFTETGEYTRIGRECRIRIRIDLTNVGSWSGNIRYTLPFTAGTSSADNHGIFRVSYVSNTDLYLISRIPSGGATGDIVGMVAGVQISALQVSELMNAGNSTLIIDTWYVI